MKRILFNAVLALLPVALHAQTPVWSTDVAPILYNHCTTCHHNGGIAPFSLITYDTAVAYAGNIKADVLSKKMPPWPPDPTYARLSHERILSAADINTIVNWVNGGTPSGTISLAPPAPVYANHGMIPGTPDLIKKIPVYTSTADTHDVYQCFVIPSGLTADKYIRAFEAIPGNPKCVHHVLVFADTTGTCAALQAASTTPPGYPDFGGVGSNSATMLGVWVPGSNPMSYPAGFGLKIPAHADIVVQVHYPAGTVGLVDSTEIHFFFEPSPTVREVFMDPILYHDNFTLIGGPLSIPADSVKTYQEQFPNVFGDMTILGAFPHMHLIGKTIESYGVLPSGDTDRYIKINKWDFHWQGFYFFRKMKKVPNGAVMRAVATYDNTSSNPNNPHSPPQLVTAGESTTNEMMIVFFVWTNYRPGDENIIEDSTILAAPYISPPNYYHGEQLLSVSPNPASDNIIVKWHFEDADIGSVELVDMEGRTVRQLKSKGAISSGYSANTYSVSGLPAGVYTLMLRTSQNVLSEKIEVH
jgi:hypothetical protein